MLLPIVQLAGVSARAYRRWPMLPRLLAILAIAAALMPSPLERRWTPPADHSQHLVAEAVPVAQRRVGEVEIAEAWHLTSRNSRFGGFSAMVIERPRQFLIGSDYATMQRFRLRPDGRVPAARLWPLWLDSRLGLGKAGRDLESLTLDPESGAIWGGFEQRHRIVRFSPGMGRVDAEREVPEMKDWNGNGGAEALVRMADGRFLVLAETSGGPGGGTDALLFDSDPVEGGRPVRFALVAAGRGRVTDAAALPDGRVLLLFRDLTLRERWVSTLAVADPATIRPRGRWRARTIARFVRPQIADNFEGLAIEPQPLRDGRVGIWMVSDDNRVGWQRTLLLRLLWQPGDRP